MKRHVRLLNLITGTILLCCSVCAYGIGTSIVFCSDRDGDNEIYVMDTDGNNIIQITDNTSDESGAMCSADGRRIAFVTDRDGNYEIYLINIDGSGLTRLTDNSAEDFGPAWSRDGSLIAFMSERDGDREIYIMNNDGTGLRQITDNTTNDNSPDFSPDGTKIAYHSDRAGPTDIWVSGLDGTVLQNLTNGTGANYMPEWSPDGSQIVFESTRHGPLELYVMDADGANVRRLTYTYSDNHEPDWSPDGSRIMFISLQGGDYDILLINPDGSGLVNLTNDSTAMDWGPSWLPHEIDSSSDGGANGMLAYCNQPVSAPDIHEIYTIHIDGTQKQQLIDAPFGLNHHEWSPGDDKMAVVGYVDGTTSSIFTLDTDGSNLTRLTETAEVWDNEPSWSSDGVKLAWCRFYPSEGLRAEIWIMDADGTNQHTIGVAGDGVRWSPDGLRLLYHKELASTDLWSCDVDGANELQLTMGAGDNIHPDWSPDGSKILFISTRDGNHEIYVMNADGTAPMRLTVSSANEFAPTWSPDGTLIAFGTDAAGMGRYEIHVMDASGNNSRRVTYSPPDRTAINPDWQHDGTNVPAYLQGFWHTRAEGTVKLMWEVAESAVPEDFRMVAEGEGFQRDVQVVAAGSRRFEAVDTVAGVRYEETVVYCLYKRADDGEWSLLGQESVQMAQPLPRTEITSVHPNPFNPNTVISFAVNEPQQVKLAIHDCAGRRVLQLVDKVCSPGNHTVRWDGCDAFGREVAAGVYLVRLTTYNRIDSQKISLVR